MVHSILALVTGLLLQLSGHWEGTAEVEGKSMPIEFDFDAPDHGVFSARQWAVAEYPFDTIKLDGTAIHLSVGGGDSVFAGTLGAASIDGKVTNAGHTGTFHLLRKPSPTEPFSRKDVAFDNGAIHLQGTLLTPVEKGAHPAVVFVHGSGPEVRWGTSFFYAKHLARNGVAALVFDKRGSGKSTGDWTKATFEDLAADSISAVRFLKSQPGINPIRIGLYGHSQGASIAPLIASHSSDIAFVVAADGIGGPLTEQELYRVRNNLVDHGFTEAQVSIAMGVYSTWLQVLKNDRGWEIVDRLVETYKDEPWFPYVEPPSKDGWISRWYPTIGAYNDLPHWAKVKVPVLLVYGEKDRVSSPSTAIERIDAALQAAGNPDVTEVVIPRAPHNLKLRPTPSEPFDWGRVPPGYPDLVAAWINFRFSKPN